MSSRNPLSAAAKAELDRTLDSLTMRAITETVVAVGVVIYSAAYVAGRLVGHFTRKDRNP
jgi:hypothetical protein